MEFWRQNKRMKIKFHTCLLLVGLIQPFLSFAQLKTGYDFDESMELIKVNFRFADSVEFPDFPAPQRFKHEYRSPVVGFDNCWDFWKDANGTGLISIRGTTGSLPSWGSNFYSMLVPATGTMKLTENDTFSYHLANDPAAAVHVGWLYSTGMLMKDILPKIDTFLLNGGTDLLITGHSQGGAIAYLVTAHLWSLRASGRLPQTLRLKTYCSAAPKPGNLRFAYSYESMTFPGWAFNTVNAADWVPETPFSIQTVNDFAQTNPFSEAKQLMKGIKIPVRWVLKHAYNKMDRPTRKSQQRFEKYLGRKLGKIMQKSAPGFEPPEYLNENAFARCGIMVSLVPDEGYFALYPNYAKENKFLHHSIQPYLYLMEQMQHRQVK